MKKVLLTAVFTILMLSSGYVIATNIADHTHNENKEIDHSGRTNSAGCHNDYKTGGYHCH